MLMRLCSHVIEGSQEAQRLVKYTPAVKFIGGYNHASEYAQDNPQRLLWGRVVPGRDDLWRSMPADIFYTDYIRPHVVHPSNYAVRAWETGLNEDFRKSTGDTPDMADMEYRAAYEAAIAGWISADGKLPILGQFAVGTPSGTPFDQQEAWRHYKVAIQTAYTYQGYISLHAYASISGWEGPLDALIVVMKELNRSVPILISECGNEPGWKVSGLSAEQYASQLVAFDRTLQTKYPQVKAAAIFACGNTPDQWANYNVDDPKITDTLIAYAQEIAVTPPPSVSEKPKFTFPGAGLPMRLYNGPNGTYIRSVNANWNVDVYELQGQWWRVTTGNTRYWVKMNFA